MQFCPCCYLLFHKNSKGAQYDNSENVLDYSVCDCCSQPPKEVPTGSDAQDRRPPQFGDVCHLVAEVENCLTMRYTFHVFQIRKQKEKRIVCKNRFFKGMNRFLITIYTSCIFLCCCLEFL